MKWSIIVFGYNEGVGFPKVIEEVEGVLQKMAPAEESFEIIAVDDGSKDDTQSVLQALSKKKPWLKVIRHPKNLGIGKALASGYRAAKGDWICAVPADGQFNCQELQAFTSIQPGNLISLFRPEKPGYSKFRKFMSLVNKSFNSTLLGIQVRDVNWVKIYNRNDLQSLKLELTDSLLVESEILFKLIYSGVKVIESPSQYRNREHGVSKANSIKTIGPAVIGLIKLFTMSARHRLKNPGSQKSKLNQ